MHTFFLNIKCNDERLRIPWIRINSIDFRRKNEAIENDRKSRFSVVSNFQKLCAMEKWQSCRTQLASLADASDLTSRRIFGFKDDDYLSLLHRSCRSENEFEFIQIENYWRTNATILTTRFQAGKKMENEGIFEELPSNQSFLYLVEI